MISSSAPRWWITQASVPRREFSLTVVILLRHGRAVAATGRELAERTAPPQADTAPVTPAAAMARKARRLVVGSTGVIFKRIYPHVRTYACVVSDPTHMARTGHGPKIACVTCTVDMPSPPGRRNTGTGRATSGSDALGEGLEQRPEGGRVVARG